jgi:uncharacterized protein (TIGR03067 family)
MRLALALLLAAGTLIAAPVPKDFKKPDDARAVLGTWAAHTLDGRVGKPHTHTFVFEPDGNCHTFYGNNERSDWTYSLDTTTTPKRMRWQSRAGNTTFDCAYELSGETFKLAFLTGNVKNPKTLEPGGGYTLYEMTRDKAAK